MKIRLNVAIRADASDNIGHGHVMRCLTLAHRLKGIGANVLFVCRDLKGQLASKVRESGFSVSVLSNLSVHNSAPRVENTCSEFEIYESWLTVPVLEDADQTIEAIQTYFKLRRTTKTFLQKIDLLIVDHYALDERWENKVNVYAKKSLVIDDLFNRPHQATFVLNQTAGIQASAYDELVNVDCDRLTGTDYALIRPDFLALREQSLGKRQQVKHAQRILVSLGGVDLPNTSLEIISIIYDHFKTDMPSSLVIDLVLGGGSPHIQKIQAYIQGLPDEARFLVNLHVDVPNIHTLMFLADIAIGSAGTTAWERCVVGLPSLIIVSADNQKANAEILCQSGASKLLGFIDDIDRQRWCDIIFNAMHDSSWLLNCANAAAALCDGLGVDRVVSKITGS